MQRRRRLGLADLSGLALAQAQAQAQGGAEQRRDGGLAGVLHPLTLRFRDADAERSFVARSLLSTAKIVQTVVKITFFYNVLLLWTMFANGRHSHPVLLAGRLLMFVFTPVYWLLFVVVPGFFRQHIVAFVFLFVLLSIQLATLLQAYDVVHEAQYRTQPDLDDDFAPFARMRYATSPFLVFFAANSFLGTLLYIPVRMVAWSFALSPLMAVAFYVAFYPIPVADVLGLFGITAVCTVMLGALSRSNEFRRRKEFHLEQLIRRRNEAVRHSTEMTRLLLFNVVPARVAKELLASGDVMHQSVSESVDQCTVVFIEFGGAGVDLGALRDLIVSIDDRADRSGVDKIKAMSYGWLGASGVVHREQAHTERCAHFALQVAAQLRTTVRIGVHTGPVVAGVIGGRLAYDIFGDTVNMASRLATTGEAGRVQVSAAVHARLRDSSDGAPAAPGITNTNPVRFDMSSRGMVAMKGKGLLETFWLESEHIGIEAAAQFVFSETTSEVPASTLLSGADVGAGVELAEDVSAALVRRRGFGIRFVDPIKEGLFVGHMRDVATARLRGTAVTLFAFSLVFGLLGIAVDTTGSQWLLAAVRLPALVILAGIAAVGQRAGRHGIHLQRAAFSVFLLGSLGAAAVRRYAADQHSAGFAWLLAVEWHEYFLAPFLPYMMASDRAWFAIWVFVVDFVGYALVICSDVALIQNIFLFYAAAHIIGLPANYEVRWTQRVRFLRQQQLDALGQELERAEGETQALAQRAFPASILRSLKEAPGEEARATYPNVCMVACDLKSFTAFCGTTPAQVVVAFLRDVFGAMDAVGASHGVLPIRTLGDAWLGCIGAPDPVDATPDEILRRAIEAGREIATRVREICDAQPPGSLSRSMAVRIGVAAGQAEGAILGQTRLVWDLFGELPMRVQGLEASGQAFKVHLGEAEAKRARAMGMQVDDDGIC